MADTLRLVLEREDTDGDFQITVTDAGPRLITLGTATSNGYKSFDIRCVFGLSLGSFALSNEYIFILNRGHYMMSNLLQELALAREHGRKRIVLDEGLCLLTRRAPLF